MLGVATDEGLVADPETIVEAFNRNSGPSAPRPRKRPKPPRNKLTFSPVCYLVML